MIECDIILNLVETIRNRPNRSRVAVNNKKGRDRTVPYSDL